MHSGGGKAVTQQKVSADFDGFVEGYGDQIDDAVAFSGLKADFFVRVKCEYLTRLTARHFGGNAGLHVLDLGCGVGNYHPHLAGAFRSLAGIDVSERSVEYARRHNPGVDYRVYPGGRLPYDDGAFDAAFASCVLHHVPLPQWPTFVEEMRRILRPGGLGIVFEHNPANPLTRRIVRDCPIDADAVLLPAAKTRALFAEAGFSAIRTRAILSIPPLAGPLYALDESLGRLGIGAQYYLAATRPS